MAHNFWSNLGWPDSLRQTKDKNAIMYSEKSRQNINGKQKGFFLQIAFNNLVKFCLFLCLFVCLFLTTLHLFSNNISSVVSFLSTITYMHGLTIKTFFFQCATELTFTIYGKKIFLKWTLLLQYTFFAWIENIRENRFALCRFGKVWGNSNTFVEN